MKRTAILLLVLFGFVYISSLGFRPLAIPDETRYGEIPREMLASGDWVVPRLNGLKYFEKPVFGYWATAISILLFGENAFALRLPSALSVIISAFMMYLLARRASPGGLSSVLAPAIFLTCPLVLAIGHIGILDSLFSMLLTGAMVSFFFAHMAERGARKTLFLALMGIFCGLAFLTKGFLAVVVPVLTVAPFLLWEGRFKDLLRISWVPVATAFLMALPWSLMIHLREGDFWDYFFWTEHVSRFLDPVGGQHPKPFWYFVPFLVGGALPWAVQGPAALPAVLKLTKENPLVRFAFCWFFFPFLFFSVSSGKLIPYILPCFPPLAIGLAIGLAGYFQAGKRRAFSVATWVVGGIACLVGAFILFSGILGNEEMDLYGPGEGITRLLGTLGAFLWAVLAIGSVRMKDPRQKLMAYCTGILVFFFIMNFALPEREIASRAPGRLLERNLSRVTPDAIVVSNDNVVRAVCWFFKRDDVRILGEPGELAYGLDHDDAPPGRLLSIDALAEMIRNNPEKRPVILVLIAAHYAAHADRLPPPRFVDSDNHFVFAVFM